MTSGRQPGPRRVLVSAGDPSGDLILSKIVQEIRTLRPEVEFTGLCGPACESAGVVPLAKSHEVAVVGIVEVLRNLGKIFSVLDRLKRELPKVDSVLCVDFPDFNLKLAGLAKKAGKPVDYLVAPQVWAWRSGRVNLMRKLIRRIYPVLPFEEEFLRDAGLNAEFFGHPIRDLLPPRNRKVARAQYAFADEDFVFCVMPGSRGSEIRRHLALLLRAWELGLKYKVRVGDRRKWRAVLPLAPGWTRESFMAVATRREREQLETRLATGEWQLVEDSRQALMAADFGWIASGTATLEAAWYQLPHVLVYRLSGLSAWLIRQSTAYFDGENPSAGLPNILLGKKVIPELLQGNLRAEALASETVEMLMDPVRLSNLRRSLRFLPKKLGEADVCQRIARDLVNLWGREG